MGDETVSRSSVSEAIRAGAAELNQAGVDSAAVEARLLMAYALADVPTADVPRVPLSATELFVRSEEPAPEHYATWVRMRALRTPLQHIVGSAPFAGLDLLSGPEGFIPRPETELLVEWACEQVHEVTRQRQASPLSRGLFSEHVTIVDVCSGPGTIALAVAHRLSESFSRASTPGITIWALEKDPAAMELARRNEAQLRRRQLIADHIEVRYELMDVRDLSQLARRGLVNTANVVLSNPPYVPQRAVAEGQISPEVLADPPHAVFGGDDGMALMPALVECCELLAAPRAAVAIEHDDSTGAEVASLMAGAGMAEVTQQRDLTGRARFVTAHVRRCPGHIPKIDRWALR